MKRVAYLDGLRGLACLQVVLYHYSCAFWPKATLGFLTDPESAVALFFLLSSFVLTKSFARTPEAFLDNAVGRIIRLGFPTLAALVICLAVASVDRGILRHAAHLTHGNLGAFVCLDLFSIKFDLSGLSLALGFAETSPWWLMHLPSQADSLDPPIWSLQFEFVGSLVVLLLVWLEARSRRVYWLGVMVLACMIGRHELCLFLIGNMLARGTLTRVSRLWGFISILSGIALSQWCEALPFISMPSGLLDLRGSAGTGVLLGATLIFTGILLQPTAQNFCGSRLPRWLGHISFPVYLLHWPIMMLIGSGAFVMAFPVGVPAASVCALLGGLPVTFLLANLFERYIDGPAVRMSQKVRFHADEWPSVSAGDAGRYLSHSLYRKVQEKGLGEDVDRLNR